MCAEWVVCFAERECVGEVLSSDDVLFCSLQLPCKSMPIIAARQCRNMSLLI